MPSARLCAAIFAAAMGFVAAFQLALALGAPWGSYAMGGAYPGVYPAAMRITAALQLPIYAALAAVVLSRAGLVLARWRLSRVLIWIVVAFSALSVVLNLITPRGGERMVWAPVAVLLLLTSLRVALDKDA